MAIALLLDLALGNLGLQFGLQHLKILSARNRRPLIFASGLRRGDVDIGLQGVEFVDRPAKQLREQCTLDLQVVLEGDLLRAGQIETRLGFLLVGDRGSADLEISLGRRKLFGESLLLRPHHGQCVLRRQHIEIRLRYPQDQVLSGGRELRLVDLSRQLALLERFAINRSKQRLRADQIE